MPSFDTVFKEVKFHKGLCTILLLFTCVSVKNSENKPRRLYFSKALFEGLIFGGAYLRREICVSKSIGLAL